MNAEEVRIGLLLPTTGIDSGQGTDTTNGLELYLTQTGYTAAGRKITLLKEDDEAKPALALTKLQKLIKEDRADFVVGPISSAVALAIRDYVHQNATPLLVPAAFTRLLTSPKQASPNIFRISETSDQANYPMGTWVAQHTNYRKVVVMASDFAGGRHSAEAFMAGFRDAGGEIVTELYPPFETIDFSTYLTRLNSFKADAVYAWFAGADAIRFVKEYKERALPGRLPLMGHSVLTAEPVLRAVGDAAVGLLTVGAYTATIDTPENTNFVVEYETAYKAWPSRYSECGWIAAALIVKSIDALKGDLSDHSLVLSALTNALPRIAPPRGPMEFDAYRQAISPIYVTRTERKAHRLMNVVIDKIPAVSQQATWRWWNTD